MKNATVVVAASTKGGCSKSTTISNLGAYLATKHKKVLFIDLDYQKNLTSCANKVNPFALKDSDILRAYEHDAKNVRAPFPKDFKPAKVNNYVDIMAADRHMDHIGNLMKNRPSIASYVLLHVFNALKLPQKYDYILIDCHNSFNILTNGAMVVADYVLSPVNPGRFSISSIGTMIESMKDLKANLVNPVTQKPFVTAKLYFIGALIEGNTKSSKEFVNLIDKKPDFIAKFRRRELVNRATTNYRSVFSEAEKEDSQAQRIVDNEIKPNFDKIIDKINGNN